MTSFSSGLKAVLLAAGDHVFREGDLGTSAYLVERGRVEIAVERGGRRVVVGRCGPGELVGEMAIIDDQPRTATATAVEDCELLLITREQLARRIDESDPVLRLCLNVVLDRFRATMAQLNGLRFGDAPTAARMADRLIAERAAAAEAALGEVRLEREIERSIHARDFELHYQPIVELASGRIAGFESLARWRHPERGLVAPDLFIPTAEASGLIVPLGRVCLAEACRMLAAVQARRLPEDAAVPHSFISVNVSGRDFEKDDFVVNLARTLAAEHADPTGLKLEITETILMRQPERASAALDRCRAMGVSIAIDDFGAGYSSLGYLHRFPIDTLKIDRSFIAAMHDDPRSLKIIQSIVGMAEKLRIPVVAEGVETARDAEALTAMGCDYAQGYLYSKPLPRADAEALFDAWPLARAARGAA